jgi:hypothetical protein
VVATVPAQLWRRDGKNVGILKRVEARAAQPQFGLAEKIAGIYAGILKIELFFIVIYQIVTLNLRLPQAHQLITSK